MRLIALLKELLHQSMMVSLEPLLLLAYTLLANELVLVYSLLLHLSDQAVMFDASLCLSLLILQFQSRPDHSLGLLQTLL